MGTLEAFLVILAVISGGLVIWSYTKSGKKWLNSLKLYVLCSIPAVW